MWLLPLLAILLQAVQLSNGAQHSNNWAVLVGTSRFFFNYRHVGNTLGVYHAIKKLGVPDSNIILMLADDMPCNPRNVEPARVLADDVTDVYGSDVEVDYRGEEVTVESFIRVLTGRHHPGTPPNKRLDSHDRSNVLVYMSGHGGDEFMKFQDSEEMSSQDLADAVEQMRIQRRYNQLMLLADTCQAATLNNHLYSANVFALGSSLKDQNSYSHGQSKALGVSVVDRFSYMLVEYISKLPRDSSNTLADLVRHFERHYNNPMAQIGTRLTLGMHLSQARVTDFFGSLFQIAPPTQLRKITTL
eukprot:TRINITY_DN34540_c0_g1_i2.p1 TRINITY_DN34540_c0_g1~~TRINITY_DN34540_c0_g1_i2.p1  ORF type:complete len:302 (+),score=72.29 TRINITY_DN34540_c0_g1_i2:201-1106(+)